LAPATHTGDLQARQRLEDSQRLLDEYADTIAPVLEILRRTRKSSMSGADPALAGEVPLRLDVKDGMWPSAGEMVGTPSWAALVTVC
jgi:hypothetical protein